jgi:uncharacterized protein
MIISRIDRKFFEWTTVALTLVAAVRLLV